MATLTVTTTHSYVGEPLDDITDIVFNDPGGSGFVIATFDAAQFDDVQISQSVQVTRDSDQPCQINVGGISGTFSIAAWTFNVPQVVVRMAGTGSADTMTGSSQTLSGFQGGAGADTLIGCSFGNTFLYGSGTEVEAGETITGGAGQDTLQIGAGGDSFDFSVATLSSIDKVQFFPGSSPTTVTFSGNQIGAGVTIEDSSSAAITLIVVGTAVDLSSVGFTAWDSLTDSVRVNGTAGIDSLIGSEAFDILAGGVGKDTLTGGFDADDFDFNLKTESKKGANRDVITDFSGVGGELDQLDLSGIDAKKGAGNQAFHFIGAKHFHDKAGELHYLKKAGFVIVEGDTNGDGRADFQIEVHNPTNDLKLFLADFIL